MPLLANRQNDNFQNITKKTRYLSLVSLFINSVSAIEAGNIKNTPYLQYTAKADHICLAEPTPKMSCARYINLTAAPTQRGFDYDPSMLPEVAEAIFALRVKHANIGEPFVINLSGNYLLLFTKDKINILDTYTKNHDVYKYQSTHPNITIGLGISKGLANQGDLIWH